MPGYSTNIAVTESGIFLRVLFKNKFVNGKTCYERLMELQKDHKNGNYLAAVRNEFKGKQVMATYGKHKVYTIDEISETNVQNRTMPFRMTDGSENEITLEKYYQIQYNKEIKDKKCLLFVTSTKNARGEKTSLYLVPELLFMTGMDESMRANESLKKNMTNRTKVTPQERMNKIYEFKKLLEKQSNKKATRINRQTGEEIILPDPDDIRNEWGLSITDFKDFQGRILEPPQILFKENEISGIQGGKFRGKKLLNSIDLNSSVWAAICTERNASVTEKMLRSLSDCSRNLGVNVDKPQIYTHHGRNAGDWIDYLKDKDLSQYRILLIVLDRSSRNFYSDIKNYIYSVVGIPCQVVLTDNASKNLSYYSNVLTQMQAKLGGRPYQIYLHDHLNKNVSEF
jgi:aubergine-like protein